MDKISFRDFYMILLPGLLIIYLFQITFLDLAGLLKITLDSIEGLLIYIITGYFIGTIFDIIGEKIEKLIDKMPKKPHPIINIINSGINGVTGIEIMKQIEVIFGINLNGRTEKEYDQTFTLIKEYVYQQPFSEIQKNITAKATLFRNLIGICIVYIFIILFCHFCEPYFNQTKTCFYEKSFIFKFTLICGLIGSAFILRKLSQSLYIEWFKSTLSHFYVFTKTK